MMSDLVEKRIKTLHQRLKEERIQTGIQNKSILEETLNNYMNENYKSAFIGAYINLVTPIAIHSKRLYKKKNMKNFLQKGDQFKFNLKEALEQCIFLDEKLKNQLNFVYEFPLNSITSGKVFIKKLTISQIRNITVHPEDNIHKILTNQLDYKKLTLIIIELSRKVHYAYRNYFHNNLNVKKNIHKEMKTFIRLVS